MTLYSFHLSSPLAFNLTTVPWEKNHHSQLATRHSQLVTHFLAVPWEKKSSLVTRHSSLATRHSQLILWQPWKKNYHSSLATCHSPFVTHLLAIGQRTYTFLSWLKRRHFRWRHFGLDILRARQIFRDIFVERLNLRGQEKRDIFLANHIPLPKCCFMFSF